MLKPKRRMTKKDLKQDEFLEFIYKAERFFRQNVKLLSYIAMGVAIVVVIGLIMYNSRKSAEVQASAAVGAAQSLFDQGKYTQVIEELRPVFEQYQGTSNAGIAVYYIASAYNRQGNYEQATNYYELYLNKYDNDRLLSASALAVLGAIQADDQNYEDAMNRYQKAIRRAPHRFLAHQFTLEAARTAFTAGQLANAETMLSTLLENEQIEPQIKSNAEEMLAMIQVRSQ